MLEISSSPKIGLALSGGVARGLAHIGVLKVLEDEGIPIHCIAGTSCGSLVGGLYAAGIGSRRLDSIANRAHWRDLVDFIIPKTGLIGTDKLEKMVRTLVRNKNIEQLPIPFAAVCVDLKNGKEVVLRSGSLAKAVKASTAIPGIFNPVAWGNHLLADGGLTNNVPVDVVRSLGADIVIAVNVNNFNMEHNEIENIFETIIRSIEIMQQQRVEEQLKNADIVLEPQVSNLNITNLGQAREYIDAGKEIAEQALPRIRQVLLRELPTKKEQP